jgi:hypothetical protein
MTKRTEPYPTKPISRKEAIEQGKFFYLTGKPCKHGHLAPRVSTCTCIECANAYTNADYHNNKAKHREQNKNWYHCHPERWKAMNKKSTPTGGGIAFTPRSSDFLPLIYFPRDPVGPRIDRTA